MSKKQQTHEKPELYVVCKGASITSRKGVLGPGEIVHPEYAPGADFKKLVEAGVLKIK